MRNFQFSEGPRFSKDGRNLSIPTYPEINGLYTKVVKLPRIQTIKLFGTVNNSNQSQEILTKRGLEILFAALSRVFKTLFSKQLKRSDHRCSKHKFELCTRPSDLRNGGRVLCPNWIYKIRHKMIKVEILNKILIRVFQDLSIKFYFRSWFLFCSPSVNLCGP